MVDNRADDSYTSGREMVDNRADDVIQAVEKWWTIGLMTLYKR